MTARGLVPAIALIAVYFALQNNLTIVTLLLMGYSFVTQLFPALLCSLLARNPLTRQGAASGIVVGVAVVAYVTLTKSSFADLLPFLPPRVGDVNVGFAALILNVAAALVVSLATRRAGAPIAAPT
jgi:SSS family solute:Na+ symporter